MPSGNRPDYVHLPRQAYERLRLEADMCQRAVGEIQLFLALLDYEGDTDTDDLRKLLVAYRHLQRSLSREES
jgi:hypothetical protein